MRVDGQKPAQDYNQSIKKFTEIFLGTENSTSNSNGMNKVLAALSQPRPFPMVVRGQFASRRVQSWA
jgi:hypothetical protein